MKSRKGDYRYNTLIIVFVALKMDEVNNFFDFSKEFTRVPVSRGCVSGNVAANAGKNYSGRPTKREYFGDQYSKHITDRERRRILEARIYSL